MAESGHEFNQAVNESNITELPVSVQAADLFFILDKSNDPRARKLLEEQGQILLSATDDPYFEELVAEIKNQLNKLGIDTSLTALQQANDEFQANIENFLPQIGGIKIEQTQAEAIREKDEEESRARLKLERKNGIIVPKSKTSTQTTLKELNARSSKPVAKILQFPGVRKN